MGNITPTLKGVRNVTKLFISNTGEGTLANVWRINVHKQIASTVIVNSKKEFDTTLVLKPFDDTLL